MADAMEFGFLFDPERKLLSIGYRVAEGRSTRAATTSSPPKRGSRASSPSPRATSPRATGSGSAAPSRRVGGGAALISWSGSMFEYLMPSLVMRAPAGSLIEQTSRLIVRRQIDYGAELGVPWGISESAYNARDLEFTYQYSNFGVPGLGLKRGLGENAVVAPYATALAAMVDPGAAVAQLRAARRRSARAAATASTRPSTTRRRRLPEGKNVAIVRAFMAHHQGMTIVAHRRTCLLDGVMRARFHAEPIVQATELLLQERTPRDVAVAHPWAEEVRTAATVRDLELPAVRRLYSAHGATPATHLLSNGRYAVMLTAAGSGYSRWTVPRSRAGARTSPATTGARTSSCATWRSGDMWSAGYQPSGAEAGALRGRPSPRIAPSSCGATARSPPRSRSSSRRRTTPKCAACRSRMAATRCARSTSPPTPSWCWRRSAADVAHPAFSKLFVQTEYLAKSGVILATRRRRSPDEPEIWAAHLAVVDGDSVGEPEIETDRARFLGRGRERANADRGDRRPAAVEYGRHRARPGLRAAPPRTGRAGRDGAHRLLDGRGASRARACSTSPTSIATPPPSSGRPPWRGRRRRCSSSTSASSRSEASLFQRLAGHLLYAESAAAPVPGRSCAAAAAQRRRSGRTASPATCRSCSRASTTSRTSLSCASCCARTSTGG